MNFETTLEDIKTQTTMRYNRSVEKKNKKINKCYLNNLKSTSNIYLEKGLKATIRYVNKLLNTRKKAAENRANGNTDRYIAPRSQQNI